MLTLMSRDYDAWNQTLNTFISLTHSNGNIWKLFDKYSKTFFAIIYYRFIFKYTYILNLVTLFLLYVLRGARITLPFNFWFVFDMSLIMGLSSESSNVVAKVFAEEDLHKDSVTIGLMISILCAMRRPLISIHTRMAYL